MNESAWPEGPGAPVPESVQRSWAATVSALPVGARVVGQVIGRRPFGVFVRVDGVPDAVVLAEITAIPCGMELPALGAVVTGEVIWHVHHNQQVKIRLDEWATPGE